MKLLSFLLLSSIPLINAAEVTKISPCFTDPSSSTCADYIYPEDLATDDMKSLCDSMPYMPGCSVRDNCPHPGLDPYCHTVSTIADVCVADRKMRNMAGCTNYNALCDAKSVVAQCKVNVYLPDIPTTDLAWNRTQGICTEMIMDGCEKCPIVGKNYPKCDILLVYSQLCMAMPEMKQCGEWAKMCLTVPNSPYCDIAASDNNPPTMKMYFHGGIYDYILFDWWVPRSPTIYALSCVAVFTLGFMLEGIKIGGLHLEHRWIMADTLRHSQKTPYSLNILFTQDIPRVIVTFFSQSLSYLVMLITMTYNYGIFCFTVLGIAVGAGVLRRFLPKPKINMEPVICQEDCC